MHELDELAHQPQTEREHDQEMAFHVALVTAELLGFQRQDEPPAVAVKRLRAEYERLKAQVEQKRVWARAWKCAAKGWRHSAGLIYQCQVCGRAAGLSQNHAPTILDTGALLTCRECGGVTAVTLRPLSRS